MFLMDVFVHIPKSSGTTIRTILSRQYGFQNICYLEPGSPDWPEGMSLADYLRKNPVVGPNIELITGHHRFGIHALLRRRCRYFSMMRNPIERSLSDYYYAFSYDQHRFRDEIRSGNLTIEQFITDGKYCYPLEQTQMLAGEFNSSEGMAATAIENLRNSFSIVGISERFDESILLTAKSMGWRVPLYVSRNVTPLDKNLEADRRASREQINLHYREIFESEMKVYQTAADQLTGMIAAEGPAFQRAFEAFKQIQSAIAAASKEEVYEKYELREDDALPPYASKFIDSDEYRIIDDYLQSPPRGTNYVGFVDKIAPEEIMGWAGDLNRDTPFQVSIWRLGERIAMCPCDIVRGDLAEAGYPPGVQGFSFKLNEDAANLGDYTVCFGRSSIEVPRPTNP